MAAPVGVSPAHREPLEVGVRLWLLVGALTAFGGAAPARADRFVCVYIHNPTPPPWIEYGHCPPDDQLPPGTVCNELGDSDPDGDKVYEVCVDII